MNKNKNFCVGFAFLAIVLALVSCNPKGENNQQNVLELPIRKIITVNRNLEEKFAATIRGKQDIDIRPQISGFITEVKVDEGDIVKKGQVLFVIDPVQFQEAVNVARANVEVAKANVETTALTEKNKKELAMQKVISEYDYQVAKNELERNKSLLVLAQAQLVSAEKDLSYTRVTSPSDGIIGQIPFRVGSLVNPSMTQPMTTVSEYSEIYAYFSMTEKKLLELSQNKLGGEDVRNMLPPVKLQLADGTIYNKPGTIRTISGIIDERTGSVSVRAQFPNKNRLLRSGGTGVIIMPHAIDRCIVVPQSATYEIQDQKFAYVLGDSAIVHVVQIETYPIDNGKEYVVTKGLKPGDIIVTEGISSISDGMAIKPTSK